MNLDNVMEMMERFNTKEKMNGYTNILHMFLIDVRSDITSPSDIKKIADVLHEMPLYLAKNLEGFDDETFWKGALKYHGGILDLIYSWFEMGVVTNLSVEDMEYGDSFK